jgi:hypothetical protein
MKNFMVTLFLMNAVPFVFTQWRLCQLKPSSFLDQKFWEAPTTLPEVIRPVVQEKEEDEQVLFPEIRDGKVVGWKRLF